MLCRCSICPVERCLLNRACVQAPFSNTRSVAELVLAEVLYLLLSHALTYGGLALTVR